MTNQRTRFGYRRKEEEILERYWQILMEIVVARNEHTNVQRRAYSAFKALGYSTEAPAALLLQPVPTPTAPTHARCALRGARRGCLRLRAGLSCLPMLLQPAHRPTASVPHSAARVLCTGQNGLKKDVMAAGVLALRARPVSRAPRRLSAALRCVCVMGLVGRMDALQMPNHGMMFKGWLKLPTPHGIS